MATPPVELMDHVFVGSPTPLSQFEVADFISRGNVPVRSLILIKNRLEIKNPELSVLLATSTKTLERLRGQRKLTSALGDRLYRLWRITRLAEQVLESPESAKSWLKRPQRGLGGRTPLGLLSTEAGAREVEELLFRMEYGILS